MSGFLNEVGPHGHRDWPVDRTALEFELELPRVQPEQNLALALIGSRVVGYAIVEPEQNIGRSVVGLGIGIGTNGDTFGSAGQAVAVAELLLDWAGERSLEFAPTAHLATRDSEPDFRAFVEQRGWRPVRKYLKLRSGANPPGAKALVPPGFTVRTMLGLDEVPELTHLQNESFRTHFGYSPNSEDEIRSRLLAPGASVDDIVMAHDSGGRLVAYCWTVVYEQAGSKIGRIGMTGVLPDEQGKGLGQTITEVGFNHLVGQGVETIELDVDTENTPAKRIYSSLGFATDSEIDWWEKSLER